MKKYIKSLITIVIVFIVFYGIGAGDFSIFAKSIDNKNNCEVSKTKGDIEIISNMITSTYDNNDYDTNLSIGNYITIINIDQSIPIRMYPIYKESECIFVAYVDSLQNVTISSDVDIYSTIYNNAVEDSIIYLCDGNLYSNNILLREKVDNSKSVKLEECYDEISSIENKYAISKKDILYNGEIEILDEIELDETNTNVISTMSLTNSNFITKKCNIKNFVTQGQNNLCWAASIATIVNYKTGTNYSAKAIADRAGIGYDTGATLSEANRAIKSYGLAYGMALNKIGWDVVKNCINNDRPFMIFLDGNGIGHVITGYGYAYKPNDSVGVSRTIHAWDSNGSTLLFMYGASTINIGAYEFQWTYTIR